MRLTFTQRKRTFLEDEYKFSETARVHTFATLGVIDTTNPGNWCPRRGIPVPGPGWAVRQGTPGHFFRLFRKTPFPGPPKNELCQSCCFLGNLSFFSLGWLRRAATSVPVIQMRRQRLHLGCLTRPLVQGAAGSLQPGPDEHKVGISKLRKFKSGGNVAKWQPEHTWEQYHANTDWAAPCGSHRRGA